MPPSQLTSTQLQPCFTEIHLRRVHHGGRRQSIYLDPLPDTSHHQPHATRRAKARDQASDGASSTCTRRTHLYRGDLVVGAALGTVAKEECVAAAYVGQVHVHLCRVHSLPRDRSAVGDRRHSRRGRWRGEIEQHASARQYAAPATAHALRKRDLRYRRGGHGGDTPMEMGDCSQAAESMSSSAHGTPGHHPISPPRSLGRSLPHAPFAAHRNRRASPAGSIGLPRAHYTGAQEDELAASEICVL